MPIAISPAVVVLCDQPAAFEYRNGLFYITDPTLGVTRAMRPADMLISFSEAAKALQAYHGLAADSDPVVVAFPRGAH